MNRPLPPGNANGVLPQPWTVLTDFDGTISLADVTDALLDRYARPGWRDIEAAWERGEIGSLTCMQEQVALIEASAPQIDALADSVEVDPHFVRFIGDARSYGIPVAVTSDGLDYVIRRVLARVGLSDLPVFANHLVGCGANRWRLEFPYKNADCQRESGICKCAFARAQSAQARVLYVGDGTSDQCVSGRVDLLFAKGALIEYARARGIPHRPIAGFDEARRLLAALVLEEALPEVGTGGPPAMNLASNCSSR